MGFLSHHVWVEIDGRTFKVRFNDRGRPSIVYEWRKARSREGSEFVTYWTHTSPIGKPTSLVGRIISAAEEIRCA